MQNVYLVKAEALPQVLQKTLEAKDLLRRGECRTVREAVARVGISRSAFYKYRDGVEPADPDAGMAVTLSLILEHQAGVLSRVLSKIALAQGNVRTINQSPPSGGVAPVTITFETAGMLVPVDALVRDVGGVPGVVRADLLGDGSTAGGV